MQAGAISDMMAKRIKNKVNPLSVGSLSIQLTPQALQALPFAHYLFLTKKLLAVLVPL